MFMDTRVVLFVVLNASRRRLMALGTGWMLTWQPPSPNGNTAKFNINTEIEYKRIKFLLLGFGVAADRFCAWNCCGNARVAELSAGLKLYQMHGTYDVSLPLWLG